MGSVVVIILSHFPFLTSSDHFEVYSYCFLNFVPATLPFRRKVRNQNQPERTTKEHNTKGVSAWVKSICREGGAEVGKGKESRKVRKGESKNLKRKESQYASLLYRKG